MGSKVQNPGGIPTREFFWPSTLGTGVPALNIGTYPGTDCLTGGAGGYVAGVIPHDFNAIDEAVLMIIPHDTNAVGNIDIYSHYASPGEQENVHTEQDLASTYNITTHEIFEIDISGILSDIAAGDYLGLLAVAFNATSEFLLVGMRLRYT